MYPGHDDPATDVLHHRLSVDWDRVVNTAFATMARNWVQQQHRYTN